LLQIGTIFQGGRFYDVYSEPNGHLNSVAKACWGRSSRLCWFVQDAEPGGARWEWFLPLQSGFFKNSSKKRTL